MIFLEKFVWIIFAHFIGDIALQSEWQAQNKGKYWYVLLSHSLIWTACICVSLLYIHLFLLWKVPFLVIGHGLMDYWKAKQPKTPDQWWKIYPDQAWHFVQCLTCYLF